MHLSDQMVCQIFILHGIMLTFLKKQKKNKT